MSEGKSDSSTVNSFSSSREVDKQKKLSITKDPSPNGSENKNKKDLGWLSFINQKLTEWPVWAKLSSYLKQDPIDPGENAKKMSPSNPETMYPGHKLYKMKEMPWSLFRTREWYQTVYEHYHHKQSGITYFYAKKQRVRIRKFSFEEMSTQIFEPPKELAQKIYFAVPTDIVLNQIEKSKSNKYNY